MNGKSAIIPKGFFSQIRNVITSKEALKDVIPVKWNEILKNRKDNQNQIVKLNSKKKD